jgi:homoaconitase/3-isopropylmalate dehydratase large subunit
MEFDGAFAPGVSAKDAMLFLIGRFGLDGGQYQAVEYRGAAIRALPMQERMTLCNMAAELGAQTGLIASDEVTTPAAATRPRRRRTPSVTSGSRSRASAARNISFRRLGIEAGLHAVRGP